MTNPAPEPAPIESEGGRSIDAHEVDAWLLDALHVGPGFKVLELAGGTGDLALLVANRVRPGGLVICSDLRPTRVAEAARKMIAHGATDIDARVIDMRQVSLPDQGIDAVLCRWGLMFAPDPAIALRETFRVLHRGGWLALSVWGDPARNRWTTLVDEVLVTESHELPDDRSAPGRMFSLADRSRLGGLLSDAGFQDVVLEEIPVEFRYGDIEAYWTVESRWADGPIDEYLAHLPDREVGRIRTRVEAAVEEFRSPSGDFRIPALALNATARRP